MGGGRDMEGILGLLGGMLGRRGALEASATEHCVVGKGLEVGDVTYRRRS